MTKRTEEWHEITVTVPIEGSEWISHFMYELGSTGNIEESAPDPALIALKGYFPTEMGSSNAITQSILEMLEQKGIKPLSVFTTTLKLQNWAKQAEQMFSPIHILNDTTIINPWSEYKPKKNEIVVMINPGMAFGTGFHATTQLSAMMIEKVIAGKKIGTMCDVGTGSGILAIIAAKKGIAKIDAVEIDPDARISTEENIKLNDMEKKITLYDHIDRVNKKYELVVANILLSTITELKNELIALVEKNGHLILSGITEEEDERLQKVFENSGLILVSKKLQDAWMGYLYAAVSDK